LRFKLLSFKLLAVMWVRDDDYFWRFWREVGVFVCIVICLRLGLSASLSTISVTSPSSGS
jgi:hypothetical protein